MILSRGNRFSIDTSDKRWHFNGTFRSLEEGPKVPPRSDSLAIHRTSCPLYRSLEIELISVSHSTDNLALFQGLVSGLGDGERGRRCVLQGLQSHDGHKQHRGLQVCNRVGGCRDLAIRSARSLNSEWCSVYPDWVSSFGRN